MLLLALALAAAPTPCPAGSTVIMSCPAKKKHIAVCAGPTTGRITWAQYRYGPLEAPELVFPTDTKATGLAPFSFERNELIGAQVQTLTFTSGDTTYEVWTQQGKGGGGGVNVKKGDKIVSTVACAGDVEEHWDALEPVVFSPNASVDIDTSKLDLDLGGPAPTPPKTPTSGGPKPDPLAGRSVK